MFDSSVFPPISIKPSLLEPFFREKGCQALVGTDEAGRGCLAGPVTAAAVVLPPNAFLPSLNDSKLLTPSQRASLFDQITSIALSWAVAFVEVEEIDQINIFHASQKAMVLAIRQLSLNPEMVLVDGKFKIPLDVPQLAVVKGDRHCPSISAASILAKVSRDRFMVELEKKYPSFHFSVHKGYPTKRHREEICKFGILPIHRKSFRLL